jgi:PLP dependent protein
VEVFAVSKFQPAEQIESLLHAGHRTFAESRVQEAGAKWAALRSEHPAVCLHLIGSLQSNKASRAVSLFDSIESVDRDKIAVALASEMARQQRSLECLVQVNVGTEPQKGGVHPAEADAFIDRCRTEYGLPVRGVMGVPPDDADPRPHFDLLRRLADRHDLPVVSMGMTSDFATAIAAGATRVRIGRALFGERSR